MRDQAKRHFASLEAIRFLAALCVVFHHAPVPEFLGSSESAALVFRSAFFGAAAVTVFFVVSGFCIHASYTKAPPADWRSYFVRRYVRILGPLLCVLAPASLLGVSYHPYLGWVTWSLIAELIYYTAYPLLRVARYKLGWPVLLVVTFTASFYAVDPPAVDASTLNGVLAFVLRDAVRCLPAWLIGCLLAELVVGRSIIVADARTAWAARFALWGLAAAAAVAHYQGIVPLHATMTLFALPVGTWLYFEIGSNNAPAPLVYLGAASYSLYLTHPLIIYGIVPALRPYGMPRDWLILVVLCVIFGLAYYHVIEKPFHDLARRWGKALERQVAHPAYA